MNPATDGEVEALIDQTSRLMAAGWRGNPNMSGDDRDFMPPGMRRRHDDKARAVVEFILARLDATTSETAKLRERVEELSEALRPFAEAIEDNDDDKAGDGAEVWEAPVAMCVTYGDFRRARSALENSPSTLADATNQKDRSNV